MERRLLFIVMLSILHACAAMKTINEGIEEMNQAASEAASDLETDLENAVDP